MKTIKDTLEYFHKRNYSCRDRPYLAVVEEILEQSVKEDWGLTKAQVDEIACCLYTVDGRTGVDGSTADRYYIAARDRLTTVYADYEAEREKIGHLLKVRDRGFLEVWAEIAETLKHKKFKEDRAPLAMALYFYEKYGDKEDASYKLYADHFPDVVIAKPAPEKPVEVEKPVAVLRIKNYKDFLWWVAGRVCSEGCTEAELTTKIAAEMQAFNVVYEGMPNYGILAGKAAKELKAPVNMYNQDVIARVNRSKGLPPKAVTVPTPNMEERNPRINPHTISVTSVTGRMVSTTPSLQSMSKSESSESFSVKSGFRTTEQNERLRAYNKMYAGGSLRYAGPVPEPFKDCQVTALDECEKAIQYAIGVNYDEAKKNVFKSIQPKETTMSAKPVETITYIYGQPVKSLTEDELIGAIKRMEGEIAEYAKVKAKSTKIDSRVKDLETAIETATAALDSK